MASQRLIPTEVQYMQFDIQFTVPSDEGSWGELWIAGMREEFEASFSYWTQAQYITSWVRSLSVALSTNRPTAIIICMTDPEQKSCIDWWPVYPVGETFFFRNAILDLSQIDCPSDAQVFDHIPPRDMDSSVSEWSVSRAAVSDWVRRMKPISH